MTNPPKITAKAPIPAEVVEGKSYFYCTCGQSKNQPFCDGSHKGTEFSPMKYVATESKKAFFCGCRQSSNSPLCDGTHNKLET